MKKLFTLLLILILYFFITIKNFSSANSSEYKILRVIDAETVYVDFNKDGYAQKSDFSANLYITAMFQTR